MRLTVWYMCACGTCRLARKKTLLLFLLLTEGLFEIRRDGAGHLVDVKSFSNKTGALHSAQIFSFHFSYLAQTPPSFFSISLLSRLYFSSVSLSPLLSFLFCTPPWVTAQYPALPGLSSLSRWLTWITVHTPRSGLVIKTVTEGIYAISVRLALSSFYFSSWSALSFSPSPSNSF